MSVFNLKQQLHAIAEQLPNDATWDDVRYAIEFRASVERGLADSEDRRTIRHEDILGEFSVAE